MSVTSSFSPVPRVTPSPTSWHSLPAYTSVPEALAAHVNDDHLYVLYPEKIAQAAQTFLTGFPGSVLYAVKANPHPVVLKTLWEEGVRHFDVASMREVELVHTTLPQAKMFLMHPVKSRALIAHAYAIGVRDFAFDCLDELKKIVAVTNGAKDLHLHLRLALNEGDAVMPLTGKFGASHEAVFNLLPLARDLGQKLGLCFHVGSQCLEANNYATAIHYARQLVDEAGVKIDSIDVGGGFPVAYPDMPVPPMQTFFEVIADSIKENNFDTVEIFGEPGRALCAEGGSTLARIELRKDKDLYLNDGVYGSLFDAGQCAWKFPVELHRDRPPSPAANSVPFRFFGPTCDSIDVMTGPFHLPEDAGEGDWVEVKHLGAYGQGLAGRFNGFHSETTVAITTPERQER
ncbi:MAG: ornithine decarboxylase [Hyphococcus sp.]|nr:MAG: ornithine decarboxylase [Marinicaulis sp.]